MDILDRIIDYAEERAGELFARIQSIPLAPENEAISMTLYKSGPQRCYLQGKLDRYSIKIQAKSPNPQDAYDAAVLICRVLESAPKGGIVSGDGSFEFLYARTTTNPYFYQMQVNQTYVYEAAVDVFADCF